MTAIDCIMDDWFVFATWVNMKYGKPHRTTVFRKDTVFTVK